MEKKRAEHRIKELAKQYNNECYFANDPIIYPKHFARIFRGEKGIFEVKGCNSSGYKLQDIEIAGIIAAHLAWGRRDMIVRDTKRAMDEMGWEPFNYVMKGKYKNTNESLHRTIKWSEFANICSNLKRFYANNTSLETLTPDEIRVKIYGQKSNPKMANKKIHMFRRWMVRNDGIVDLGLWKNTSAAQLIIPLDVHVHRSAINLGITSRKGADFTTAQEITNYLKTIFPNDPCLGDFALFAHSVTLREEEEKKRKNGEI